MALLVDYRCTSCGSDTEQWVAQPIAATIDCSHCGRPARRRFGVAALIVGATKPTTTAPGVPSSTSCADHAGIPGSCTMTAPATRMLAARASGENSRIDREWARQEAAIADGSLDPSSSVVAPSPAHHRG